MPPWAKVQPRDFTALLKKIRERPDAALLESVLLRSQSLAVYSPDNVGHFGLALEAYAHFTSPIRRYPDLLVHRAIKHALSGGNAGRTSSTRRTRWRRCALQCSERERRADEAEREVDERYRAAWMEQHVGGEFDGVISGVTSFGLFVELDDSKVNGLVHVTQLPNDYLPLRPDPQDAHRRTHRARVPPGRPRRHRRAEGERRGPQDRLPPGGGARRETAAAARQAGEAGEAAVLRRCKGGVGERATRRNLLDRWMGFHLPRADGAARAPFARHPDLPAGPHARVHADRDRNDGPHPRGPCRIVSGDA